MSTAAVAAAAMAALTASQAPGLNLADGGNDEDGGQAEIPRDGSPGDDSYHTELPPLDSPEPAEPGADDDRAGESGIPATVLAAYKKAENALAGSDARCALPWELLAAIGKVESGHARGGAVDKEGTTSEPILGPVLNGEGFANIRDTDAGVYDGDTTYDRAVGPMQFIPSTWSRWGADGNGDGRQDPNNVFDAALAAGEYLCAGERDLSVKSDLDQSILSYNHSQDYLRTVLSWLEFYREGVHEVPDGTGPLPTSPGAGGDDDGNRRGGGSGGNGGGSGDDGRGGGNSESPAPDPSDPTPSPSDPEDEPTPDPTDPEDEPSPDPTDPAPAGLGLVGDGTVAAMAGEDFTERLKVRVTSADGEPVGEARVKYEITGDTDSHFEGANGGMSSVTVGTGSDGTATAPVLQAGQQAGKFTVRATVVGTELAPVDFTATVSAPKADTLARTSDDQMTATVGNPFAELVGVKATYKGKTAAGVPVTATMVTDGEKPVENDKGPYFKDSDGNPVRTLTGLKTDENGLLELPEITADGNAGTFLLRLTTADGAALTIELTVTGS